MHQDSFRSVVCRSLSKSLPSRSKDGSYPETVEYAAPSVVTLQPSISCQGRERSWSQSYREERSMSLQRDYLTAPSLSKHFAEDLLRGAMDLQESLAMLERFQAASQSMRHSSKKIRPEMGEKSPDIDTIIREVLLRPSNAKKVPLRTVSNGVHGQLSNSTDDLKNLVKDSPHKKNLLSVPSSTEQASLSQSTRYSLDNVLVSKTTQQKKVVRRSFPSCAPVQTDRSSPSLVAKLMGLDGLPSQNDHSVMKDEKSKPVSSPRALFDIEMPKSTRLLSEEDNCRFDTEAHPSEKLPPEHYNAGMNYTHSQKVISPSYDTSVVNKIGSMKPIHREKNTEQVRPKSPKEIKVASPTSRKQQTKEATEINRRTREKQKTHLTERNKEGMKDVKAKTSPASRNDKTLKTDKKLAASSSSGSMKPILQKRPGNFRQKTTTRRNGKTATVDEIMAYQLQREINHVLDEESDGPSTEHSATPSDESTQSADWDAESSVDDVRNDFSETNESFISTSRGESISSAAEDGPCPSTAMIPKKGAEIKDEISLLLITDQSFLSRAAEMTGIGTYDHLTKQYKAGPGKPEMKDRELYLDIAAEQLERKQAQRNRLCYAGFQGEKRRAYMSLEALLTDISNGIRKLNGYAVATDACGTADGLHKKLERDLSCTDSSINGVWDMGWEDWVCMEGTECFVRDAGEDILWLLIEEAALEMCIH